MLFFKKKNKQPSNYDIYSPYIKGFGNIYCTSVTYEDDNIDLNKIPHMYCSALIYDGYDFNEEDLDLYFSLCLLNKDDEYWGSVSVSKKFTVEYNIQPKGKIDKSKNLTSNRIIISQKFPFIMVSMFYKEDDGCYFYAKATNGTGIYICIHLKFKDYIIMQYVITNLYNRSIIESSYYMLYSIVMEYRKKHRISFVVDFRIHMFSLVNNNNTLLLFMSINKIPCTYVANIDMKNKVKFVYNCINSRQYVEFKRFEEIIKEFRAKNETPYMVDNLIKSDYLKDIKRSTIDNIQTTYYAMEDIRYLYKDSMINGAPDDNIFRINYIQIDEPAVFKLYKYITTYIQEISETKVSIE